MSNSGAFLDAFIDPHCEAATSVVRRYRHAFRFEATDRDDAAFKDLLLKTSLQEGARIFSLMSYKGVEIYVLDETSLMHTRTLKSIDGCVTIARCLQQGYTQAVFESGGNTGNALTAYGVRAGIETYLFIPEENVHLLNSRLFESPRAHLVSVADPGLVKSAAQLFEQAKGYAHIPKTPWRIEASRFRGLAIVEFMARQRKFDWLAQTISAGFGPIGIYWALRKFAKELGSVPRFFGIQQAANCPLYRAWTTREQTVPPTPIDSTEKLLTKVMYDANPQTYGTCQALIDIVDSTQGALTTLAHAEFDDFLKAGFAGRGILDLLRDQGVAFPGEVVERTGLMALAGTLKAIDLGMIAKGATVLACLTSGMTDADGKAKPEYRVTNLANLIPEYERQLQRRT
jgi:hypothetical protein